MKFVDFCYEYGLLSKKLEMTEAGFINRNIFRQKNGLRHAIANSIHRLPLPVRQKLWPIFDRLVAKNNSIPKIRGFGPGYCDHDRKLLGTSFQTLCDYVETPLADFEFNKNFSIHDFPDPLEAARHVLSSNETNGPDTLVEALDLYHWWNVDPFTMLTFKPKILDEAKVFEPKFNEDFVHCVSVTYTLLVPTTTHDAKVEFGGTDLVSAKEMYSVFLKTIGMDVLQKTRQNAKAVELFSYVDPEESPAFKILSDHLIGKNQIPKNANYNYDMFDESFGILAPNAVDKPVEARRFWLASETLLEDAARIAETNQLIRLANIRHTLST